MAILVDPRAGSSKLAESLRAIGAPVQDEMLVAGDVSFTGRGPEERPVAVGVEYKTLSDLLACIVSGRFSDVQLPGLQALYEHYWLLVEGAWKPAADGTLLLFHHGSWVPNPWSRRAWKCADVNHWLTSIEVMGGVKIARTSSRAESAFWVKSLYSWWTGKAFEEHDAHQHRMKSPTMRSYTPPSPVEIWAASLPGVGPKRAKIVGESFSNPRIMANAPADEWVGIEGIGPKTAEKVVRWIREGK